MSKATVLGISCADYKKKTVVRLVLCLAAFFAVVAINIALYCTVTRQTKLTFTIINTVLDIACAWWLLYYGVNVLSLRHRLMKMYQKTNTSSFEVNGVIRNIAASQKVFHFDCVTVALETEDGIRKIFVIEDSFKNMLGEGKSARFTLADNIAIECEVEDEK